MKSLETLKQELSDLSTVVPCTHNQVIFKMQEITRLQNEIKTAENKKEYKVRMGGLVPCYLIIDGEVEAGQYRWTCDPWNCTQLTYQVAVQIAETLQPFYSRGVRAYDYDKYN